ncbi:prolipoprotein diacylglyceryl transferase [Alkalithermobacter paradoxus]|uniref:Phosphatidylglycerol--prolipoprotein diacylglyceryl transferase n=1 Tax=Alkalithermobacter paradoxus TaxID=29349 RepID=A0A1V4IA23_9FIRM|nr:prolipoprotein diacylglyceryl transferase [[Clostridium] thermoalcaliphilum]
MNPVAFSILGVDIRWYGILISTGIILGILLAVKQGRKLDINEDKLIDLYLIAVPSAIVGARIYYVIFNWAYYKGDILKIINIRSGGLAIHGGIIGGVIAAYIYCKVNKIDFNTILDISAPSLILGQAIGRWGNFFNQEAYGRPTNLPWAITVDGVKVHPTFLYESLWNICLFLFLIRFRDKAKYRGQVFIYYAGIYSVGRFIVESFRIDSLMIGPLRTAQVISILTIGICFLADKYLRNNPKYSN